jgi:hypothetical protein
MQSDNVIFNITDCTLHYNDNIIEYAQKSTDYFSYILIIHLSFTHLLQAEILRFCLKCNTVV